jgi:hypothetical protein
MKKKLLIVMMAIVLLVPVVNGYGAIGDGMCSIKSETTWSEPERYVEAYTYISGVNWHYLHAFLYVNEEIATAAHDHWGFYVDSHFLDTSVVELNEDDIYYGISYHGTGPTNTVCDDEWVYKTPERTYNSSKNSIIKDSSISKKMIDAREIFENKYSAILSDTDYSNLSNISNEKWDNQFKTELQISVLSKLHRYYLDIGDLAPSIWVDFDKKIVYSGTIKENRSLLLVKSSWEELKDEMREWTELKIIE